QGYGRVKDIAFSELVFRLSLRALPGEDSLEDGDRERLWVVARDGLARSILTYLWRNRVRAEAARVQPPEGAFAERGGLTLTRINDLPPRMLTLFRHVPGLEVHRPVGENCIVQLGFRHPLRLESCGAVFEKDKFYLFSGARDAVDVLEGVPPLVPVGDLIG